MRTIIIFCQLLLMNMALICQPNEVSPPIESNDSTNIVNEASKAEEQLFFERYEIGSMRGIRSKLLEDSEMRSAPEADSPKTGIVIQKNEIVYVYKYYKEERCWATNFNDHWGFVKDEVIFPVFENTNEKQASKYDEPPQLKSQIKPEYPPEAKEKGIKGKVYVKIFIDENGIAQDAIILRGIEGLDQAAIDAVKNAKYKAARFEGKAVGVWVNLSITFN